MNRSVKILLLGFLMVAGLKLTGQQKAKVFVPAVYLGKSEFRGGPIKKDEFSNLLRQGLTSHDSSGNRFKVVGFNFGYGERQLYEDSVGNLQVMIDYASEFCPGDTVSDNIARNPNGSIYERVKPGDTIYFERVNVVRFSSKNKTLPDSTAFLGRSLKCWIVK